jgi:hypothetical protein
MEPPLRAKSTGGAAKAGLTLNGAAAVIGSGLALKQASSIGHSLESMAADLTKGKNSGADT